MGGDSSSSNQTTNNNTQVSGSNGVQGDNFGAQISGVNDSIINVEQTDFGAIENAFDFANDALITVGDINSNALDAVQNANNNLADLAGQTAASAADNMAFATDIFDKSLSTIENNKSGGATQSMDNMKTIVMGLIICLGAVGVMYAYKRK